ncbi:MAG TPA: TOBE domain-containing protein, partial [Dongiaceae bacterium]|nr:TOBE domain-containing protein [Dongiaceae bacterium]
TSGRAIGEEITIGIRPEHIAAAAGAPVQLDADVEFVEQLGGTSYLHAPNTPAGALVIRHLGGIVQGQQRIRVGFDPRDCHVFSADGISIGTR